MYEALPEDAPPGPAAAGAGGSAEGSALDVPWEALGEEER